jgi:glycosyltransferase involved in cell wall biosynthesis
VSSAAGHRPIRVLHMVDNLGMGGAETWLIALLQHWRAAGGAAPQVEILATGGTAGVYDKEAEALGARIHYAPYRRGMALQFVRAFRRILDEGQFTALHDHQGYASGWHYLMGAGSLPPVRISHVHNRISHLEANYLTSTSRRLAARSGTALMAAFATFIAGTSAQSLTEYGFDRLRGPRGLVPSGPLYCGIDPGRFAGGHAAARCAVRQEFGWPADARIVLTVGRIDMSADFDHPLNQKNSAFAVAVGIELARCDPRVRMLLVGDGSPATDVLKRRVREAGLDDRFVFAGRRRDVERLMMGADALLFPSRTEGLGMVAVEAQAAGLPVLASTATPVECVVAPELIRFRAVAGDPQAWAQDLAQLMAMPRDVDAANALVAASPYAIARSAAALEALYVGRGA